MGLPEPLGLAPQVVRSLEGEHEAVTATGSSQSDAYAIRQKLTTITSGANTTGVVLPAANAGDWAEIGNYTATIKYLYPPSGGQLNNGTEDAAGIIWPRSAVRCKCINTVDWLVTAT